MQSSVAPSGELVEFALGHRLRGREYQIQPVAVARPQRGSVDFVVPCLTCGQPVTVSVGARGAGAFFRTLFWRWNFAISAILLAFLGLCPLSLSALLLISWLSDPSSDPTAVIVLSAFAVLMLGMLALPLGMVAAMRNSPRIVDSAEREASSFVIGNFGLDQQHHLLTKDGTRRLPSERLRGRAGYLTPMRVAAARPTPTPVPAPAPASRPYPGVSFVAGQQMVGQIAGVQPVPSQLDPDTWGAALGRTHAAEAHRTGVVLSGEQLTAYAQQLAQAAAASLRIVDPVFLARYASAYVAAYSAGLPPAAR